MRTEPEEILACPRCKGELRDTRDELRCPPCGLAFPRRNGIAILLLQEARRMDEA